MHPTRAWIRNSTRSKTWRWIWGNLVWDALGALAPWAAKSIVDVGCGTGFWLPRYAKSAHTVIGVETGTSLLAAARARTGAAVVLHGSAEHLPLADGRVDVIHARFAYFFPSATNDCTAGLAEALRVLRPGGSLIVIDNDHRHGEFAALLARSSRAGSQGHDEHIRRWWAQAGAQRHEVMSSWRFQTPEELGRVLSMEFGREAVEPWLQQNPERTELSYGYVLHHLRRGA